MQVWAEGEFHADTAPDALVGDAFDRGVFDRTSNLLGLEGTLACLRVLHARGGDMLDALREAETDPAAGPALREAAHTMAGSAGLFGFNLVAAVARGLETAPAAATARALERAVTDMQTEIGHHLPPAPPAAGDTP